LEGKYLSHRLKKILRASQLDFCETLSAQAVVHLGSMTFGVIPESGFVQLILYFLRSLIGPWSAEQELA